jgi:hypothetical protein
MHGFVARITGGCVGAGEREVTLSAFLEVDEYEQRSLRLRQIRKLRPDECQKTTRGFGFFVYLRSPLRECKSDQSAKQDPTPEHYSDASGHRAASIE